MQKNSDKMADTRPESLSGNVLQSFAYLTIRDRLPGILTKVVDMMSRMASEYHNQNEIEKAEDAKAIIGKLSKLKNEMQTDKTLSLFEDSYDDVEHWNKFISTMPLLKIDQQQPTWFSVAWLSCECYLYRRIFSSFQLSKLHQAFDPFLDQKQTAFTSSQGAMKTLAEYVLAISSNNTCGDTGGLRSDFEMLLEYCLWGNKCDLSISAGIQMYNQLKESNQLKSLLEHIISNHTEHLWEYIESIQTRSGGSILRIDFVLDNAGFELFTDLCFAEFLVDKKLCDLVHFHVKSMPWFVSDTLKTDFLWTIDQCVESTDQELRELGNRWKNRVADGTFVVVENPYWTLPNDFSDMKAVSADLYGNLSDSRLVIFKGDLNYRKLIGDRNWPHTTSFKEALHGFCPAPLCTLRTLKADLVVGLVEGKSEEVQAEDSNWMVKGKYAVVQFCRELQK